MMEHQFELRIKITVRTELDYKCTKRRLEEEADFRIIGAPDIKVIDSDEVHLTRPKDIYLNNKKIPTEAEIMEQRILNFLSVAYENPLPQDKERFISYIRKHFSINEQNQVEI